jgi:hypothetical protein
MLIFRGSMMLITSIGLLILIESIIIIRQSMWLYSSLTMLVKSMWLNGLIILSLKSMWLYDRLVLLPTNGTSLPNRSPTYLVLQEHLVHHPSDGWDLPMEISALHAHNWTTLFKCSKDIRESTHDTPTAPRRLLLFRVGNSCHNLLTNIQNTIYPIYTTIGESVLYVLIPINI